MFRKNYFTFLAVIALSFSAAFSAFAQTAPVTGHVDLTKADGTTVPLEGATVEVYRTDIKGKLPAGKTDKKGNFSFAGLPLGATFVLAVSAPGAKSGFLPDVKAGAERLVIAVSEGDGKPLTEDEVRNTLAAMSTAAQNGQPSASAADQKKAEAEYQKKVVEYESKKKNAENSFAIASKAQQEGNKAYESNNYDLAITKFDEGINADPDFAGSAPVLLNNKVLSLLKRATGNYNQSTKADAATKAEAMKSVKKDFEDAVVASNRSIEILKAASAKDAAEQKNYDASKFQALVNRKEAYRLMIKTGADRTKGKEALVAFQEYLAAETDAKKKMDAQLALAIALQDSNDFDQAIVEFEKVLATEPNNIDALSGAGFSLINVGYISNDKTKFQQGANYLQKFTELAPDTNQYKNDAKGLIETLKKEQSVTPQKSSGKRKP